MWHTVSFVISEIFLYVIAKVEIGSHLIYCNILLIHMFVKLLNVHLVCDCFTFTFWFSWFMHIEALCHETFRRTLKVSHRWPSHFLGFLPECVFKALTGLCELISMFNKILNLLIFLKAHWCIIKLWNSTCIRYFLLLIVRYLHLPSNHIHSLYRYPLSSFFTCSKRLIQYISWLLIYCFNVFILLNLIKCWFVFLLEFQSSGQVLFQGCKAY